MKKISLYLLLLLPAFLLFSTVTVSAKSSPGKKTFELTYKMSQGQTFTMSTEGSTVIKTDQMGQMINVEINSASENGYRILTASPDGTMNCELEYKSMKQSAKTPNGDNSTDYSTWIGKKVQFNVAPRGTLSDFKGFDQLSEISSATGEKITGELTQKGMSNQFFELPDHAVKIGETWTVKNNSDIPYAGSTLKSEVSTIYTVIENVKKDGMDCLKIEAAGVQKLSGEFEQAGNQLELTRETKSSSVIWFALEKGMYISMESTSAGTSQIFVPAAGVTIPQEITGKSTVKVVIN